MHQGTETPQSRSKGCILQAVKQTCCTLHLSVKQFKTEQEPRTVGGQSVICTAHTVGRAKEPTGIRHLISHLLVEFARALKPYWPTHGARACRRCNQPPSILLAESWQRTHHDMSRSHARSHAESTSSCLRSAIPAKVFTAAVCPRRPQDSAKARPSVRKSLSCDL